MRRGNASSVVLALVVAVSVLAPAAACEDGADGIAEWTIMVYVAGDNDLEAEALADLDEIEGVGSTDDVRVVMLIDTLTLLEGTHWYFVEPGEDHIDIVSGVHECDCDEVVGGCPHELNMGDGATLEYFVSSAARFVPAENYMLILWDHGASWYGVCWDDGSVLPDGSDDMLRMPEISDAVESAAQTFEHGSMRIIGFDACLMAGVEVAYELRGCADYMVAAVTTIPRQGWAYAPLLEAVNGMDEPDAEAVGVAAVDTYIDKYATCVGGGIGGYPYITLSLIDLSAVGDLVTEGVAGLSTALLERLEEYPQKAYIQRSEARTPQLQYMGEQDPFVDLGLFALVLAERIPGLGDLAGRTVELIDDAVVHHDYLTSDSGACMTTLGITIFYTCSWNHLFDYGGVEHYATLDIGEDTQWDEFLLELSDRSA